MEIPKKRYCLDCDSKYPECEDRTWNSCHDQFTQAIVERLKKIGREGTDHIYFDLYNLIKELTTKE